MRTRTLSRHTVHDAGIRGFDDPDVLAFCARERRVLVTDDAHFLGFVETHESHVGVIFCPRGSHSIGHVVRTLALIHDILDPDEVAGRVEFA